MNNSFINRLSFIFQFQIILGAGLFFCLLVSLFYEYINDSRYPEEVQLPLITGIIITSICYMVGNYLKPKEISDQINLRRGVQIVIGTWILSCAISSVVFVLYGFPDPELYEQIPFYVRFIDGFFESMSGFTTAGSSILKSVEVFPRSVLLWRSLTHLIGGMGIAYLAITIIRGIKLNRSEIINAESEGPSFVIFDDDKEAIQSGWGFLKIYLFLTALCILLLFISGIFFRTVDYVHWYDNLFDAINFAFSVLGTGGFSIYDTSAGLPLTLDSGQIVSGGIMNAVSERIMIIFMFIAGANFAVWYALLFQKKTSAINNTELKWYFYTVILLGFSIAGILYYNNSGDFLDHLRSSFFSVLSAISTTGLATVDWSAWPIAANGLIFITYITGACVGSTAGGIKFQRIVVLWKYMGMQIKNLIDRDNKNFIEVDGTIYKDHHVALIGITVVVYFFFFLLIGTILLKIINPVFVSGSGAIIANDFSTSFGAMIANLGNIGPSFYVGAINHGPAGNYSQFNYLSKLFLSFAMLFGRVGVLSLVFLFVRNKNTDAIADEFSHIDFDENTLDGLHLKK